MRKLLRAGLTAATICLAALAAPAFAICPNPNPNPAQRVAADFNGDCKSDVLWRNTSTGENYFYFMNGLSIASQGPLYTEADQAWQVAGIGDFNGDGKADILWRNARTGENYIYFMNGLTIAAQGPVYPVADQAWQVAGIGDFDGDGKADILWRNRTTGESYIYFMNALIIPAQGPVYPVADQAWQVAGIGDFNGDGKADILWRNTSTGENYFYLMNGLSIASQGALYTVPQSWKAMPAATQYTGLDVGAPALVGWTNVIVAGSAYDVTAAGADIYGASDQFRFEYKVQSGDFDLPVRVASLTAVNAWSKAGLMARENMAADSREVSVFATPAGGYEFQYRATAGALVQKVDSVQKVSYPNTWVRLKRAGNVFSSYTSVDGMTWTAFGTTTLALPATVFLGMATTSHNVAQTVLAQYRNLTAGSALPNTTPPSIPGGLTAVAVSGSQINLSWNASTDNVGVAGYKVLRGGVQIATTSALTYADTALSPSTAYSYAVAAYDTAGITSAPSSAASATTQAATPPSIPTGLSASAISASQINLSWNASTDPVGVTGYNVMRNGVLIAAVSVLTYADTGLSPSTTYPYTVAAFNAAGYTSAQSAPLLVTTPSSTPPGPAQRPAYNTGTGFFVLGKTLYDADGYEFRIR